MDASKTFQRLYSHLTPSASNLASLLTLRLHQYDYSLGINGYYHVLLNDFQPDSSGQPPMHLQYVTTPSAV